MEENGSNSSGGAVEEVLYDLSYEMRDLLKCGLADGKLDEKAC